MPPKVRELTAKPEQTEFTNRGGKGSHQNYVHPKLTKPITVSGKPVDDAKYYFVKAIQKEQ